jgi:non-ribosomal peptide synthetase component F
MPLFNVAFGMQKAHEQEAKLNGLEINPAVAEPERAGLDLMLWVTESIEKTEIRWTYSRDLFEEKTIMRMHSHFEALLFDIVDRPDARLTTLKVMLRTETRPAPEEQDEWNKSEIEELMSNKRKGINLSIEPA